MTQALKGRKLLLVGFTLFSMFFGAGNLIFPPDLGAKAGANLWPAFLGLAISAVGLPVAGVIAVARADGLDKLAGRVHPVFAQVFMILIYLSIGPCLAIPRTASTSFAMLTPHAPGTASAINLLPEHHARLQTAAQGQLYFQYKNSHSLPLTVLRLLLYPRLLQTRNLPALFL